MSSSTDPPIHSSLSPTPPISALVETTSSSIQSLSQTTQQLIDTLAQFRLDISDSVDGLQQAVTRLGSALDRIEATRANRIAPRSRQIPTRRRLAMDDTQPRRVGPEHRQGEIMPVPRVFEYRVLHTTRQDPFYTTYTRSPLNTVYRWAIDPPVPQSQYNLMERFDWGYIDVFDLWMSGSTSSWPLVNDPGRYSPFKQSRLLLGLRARSRRAPEDPVLENGDFRLATNRLADLLSSLETRQRQSVILPPKYPLFWICHLVDIARCLYFPGGAAHIPPPSTGSQREEEYQTCLSFFLYVLRKGTMACVANLSSYQILVDLIKVRDTSEVLSTFHVARAFGYSDTPANPAPIWLKMLEERKAATATIIPVRPIRDWSRSPEDSCARDPIYDSLMRHEMPTGLPPTNMDQIANSPFPCVVRSSFVKGKIILGLVPVRREVDASGRRQVIVAELEWGQERDEGPPEGREPQEAGLGHHDSNLPSLDSMLSGRHHNRSTLEIIHEIQTLGYPTYLAEIYAYDIPPDEHPVSYYAARGINQDWAQATSDFRQAIRDETATVRSRMQERSRYPRTSNRGSTTGLSYIPRMTPTAPPIMRDDRFMQPPTSMSDPSPIAREPSMFDHDHSHPQAGPGLYLNIDNRYYNDDVALSPSTPTISPNFGSASISAALQRLRTPRRVLRMNHDVESIPIPQSLETTGPDLETPLSGPEVDDVVIIERDLRGLGIPRSSALDITPLIPRRSFPGPPPGFEHLYRPHPYLSSFRPSPPEHDNGTTTRGRLLASRFGQDRDPDSPIQTPSPLPVRPVTESPVALNRDDRALSAFLLHHIEQVPIPLDGMLGPRPRPRLNLRAPLDWPSNVPEPIPDYWPVTVGRTTRIEPRIRVRRIRSPSPSSDGSRGTEDPDNVDTPPPDSILGEETVPDLTPENRGVVRRTLPRDSDDVDDDSDNDLSATPGPTTRTVLADIPTPTTHHVIPQETMSVTDVAVREGSPEEYDDVFISTDEDRDEEEEEADHDPELDEDLPSDGEDDTEFARAMRAELRRRDPFGLGAAPFGPRPRPPHREARPRPRFFADSGNVTPTLPPDSSDHLDHNAENVEDEDEAEDEEARPNVAVELYRRMINIAEATTVLGTEYARTTIENGPFWVDQVAPYTESAAARPRQTEVRRPDREEGGGGDEREEKKVKLETDKGDA